MARAERASGPGRGRHDIGRSIPRTTHIRRMRRVDQPLIRCIGMDSREQATTDAERVLENLRHWRRTVRRAAGVADDSRIAIHDFVIDAHHQGRIEGILAGNGEDHPLGAGLEMLFELGDPPELTGRLDDVVDLELLPGQLARILLGEDHEGIPIDIHGVVIDLGRTRIAPMDTVVFERVEQRLGRRDVIDRDDIEMATQLRDSRDGSTDSTEAVDRDLGYRHLVPLLVNGAPGQSSRPLDFANRTLAGPRDGLAPHRKSA